MAIENTVVRDYVDNFSVKELMTETVIPKYFDDSNISLRTIGMLGYTTELVTNTSEDSFNTSSVLFRESFANRAQMDESIYSHASIFQLDDMFANASKCKFLLILEENAILQNMKQTVQGSSIYNFYVDKNTTIFVENKPYTLDYDIQMNIIRKITDSGDDYVFTAQYIMDEYTYGNSISDIADPYIKLRRSADGYIALEVVAHQCIRDTRYETIISNSTINYPTIEITNFNGKLAGFDVMYTDRSGKYAKNGPIQMRTQIVYSQAIKTPFCYYQVVNDDTIRITFNTKDLFFMPEFNSELEIILYITEGVDGNFDVYNGTNITLAPSNEKYAYSFPYLVGAKPIGASLGGTDAKDIADLQALTVEGYRTAKSLTTDHDLQQYFNNYTHRYDNTNILFIKKRDDIFERVFSAFMVMNNDGYIYKTNTLNLKLNLYDMNNPTKDIFMLDPGCLFTANETDGFARFLRDDKKNELYYNEYLQAVQDGDANYLTESFDPSSTPNYLQRACSFAQYKSRKGLDDKRYVFDLTEDEFNLYDNPNNGKFLLVNPFLIRFTKSPNVVSTYMTVVSNTSVVDFVKQNDESYVQFITYSLNVDRKFSREKKYDVSMSLAPSIMINEKQPIITIDGKDESGNVQYHLNDPYSVDQNDLRVFMLIKDGSKDICYIELYPSELSGTNTFTYRAVIETDDHITSESYMRLLPGTIYRNRETGEYYKVYQHDATLYHKYDKSNTIIEYDVPVDTVTELINSGELYEYTNIHNMTVNDNILIPLSEVTCEIYTMYKRHYDEDSGELIENEPNFTNNKLSAYDDALSKYIWTNEYLTSSEPITFIKLLDSIRSNLIFDDHTSYMENDDSSITYMHDILDATIYSIGFLRARTVQDNDRLVYFMKSFYNHYMYLNDIIRNDLRNATNIDVKFYNTYGRSVNFLIGENGESLNTVNLSLYFDMWFITGTDLVRAMQEVKAYIKSEVESINEQGANNLFISNLMRKIESKFIYVDHIRFKQINKYDSTYQAIKNYATDLNTLTVLERRFYVPELLVCDLDDIHITEYYV